MNDKDTKQLLAELQGVKMLLILQLLGQGFRQSQIALMLNISEATMSRMMPKGLSKTMSKRKSGASISIGGETDGSE